MKNPKEVSEEIKRLCAKLKDCALDLPRPYSDKVFFAMAGLRELTNELTGTSVNEPPKTI